MTDMLIFELGDDGAQSSLGTDLLPEVIRQNLTKRCPEMPFF